MSDLITPDNADLEHSLTLIQVAHPDQRRKVARAMIRAAVAEEREACARIAEEREEMWGPQIEGLVSSAIRARGEG